MYNTSSFLESGKKILNLGVHDSSIQDANTMFLQSIRSVTRDSEVDPDYRIFSTALSSFKDYDKYQDLFSKYKYSGIEKQELEEISNRISKSNALARFIKWSDSENLDDFLNKRKNKKDDEGQQE